MAENSLLEKVMGLQEKYDDLQKQLADPADPEVISDMKKYVQLNKEYKELAPIIQAGQDYKRMMDEYESAKEILAVEKDEELREMAKEEIADIEQKIPAVEENIKLLLIPADPQDSKNAILEIRGGTGGDEAAIFAGDLFRMYSKYGEERLEDGSDEPVGRCCRRIQGNSLQSDRRPCVRYSQIRIGSAPGTACATDGDSGQGTYFCRIGGGIAGGG